MIQNHPSLLSRPNNPIEYVGAATATSTAHAGSLSISLTSLTGGIDTSPSEGDLILVFAGQAVNTGSPTIAITGYTLEISNHGQTNYPSFTAAFMSVGTKEAGASETSVAITSSDTANNRPMFGLAHVFRYVDTASPFDVTSQTAGATGTAATNPPSITPSTDGAWIVAGGISAHNAGGFSLSSSDLTDFTQAQVSSGNMDGVLCAGYKDDWTSGAFDPAVFSLTGGNAGYAVWAGVSVVLKP